MRGSPLWDIFSLVRGRAQLGVTPSVAPPSSSFSECDETSGSVPFAHWRVGVAAVAPLVHELADVLALVSPRDVVHILPGRHALAAPVVIPVPDLTIMGASKACVFEPRAAAPGSPLVLVPSSASPFMMSEVTLDMGKEACSAPLYLMPGAVAHLAQVTTLSRGTGLLAAYMIEPGAKLSVELCDFTRMFTDHVAYVRPLPPRSPGLGLPGAFLDGGGNMWRMRGSLVAGDVSRSSKSISQRTGRLISTASDGGPVTVPRGKSSTGSSSAPGEPVSGVVWDVSSDAEFAFAAEKFGDGDHLVLAPGTYELTEAMWIGNGLSCVVRSSRKTRKADARVVLSRAKGSVAPFASVESRGQLTLENVTLDNSGDDTPAFVIDGEGSEVVLKHVDARRFGNAKLGLGVVGGFVGLFFLTWVVHQIA